MERAVFEYATVANWNAGEWHEGELAVTTRDDGKVLVAVTEEQAVDSYNSTFTCSALLPPEKVDELIAFLQSARTPPLAKE